VTVGAHQAGELLRIESGCGQLLVRRHPDLARPGDERIPPAADVPLQRLIGMWVNR
jgi:hypothetical protein